MTHQDVELLAIGAGPSNLALAVALEELAPDDLARNSLLIERSDAVAWQRGLLLPWVTSQISFLKDLVTLRNPSSRFSFVNYMHSIGRLDEFINLGGLWPYRTEISSYLNWVANSLAKVRLELGRECLAVQPRRNADGTLAGWTTRLADGSTISSRYLVIAGGRDANIPAPLAGLPQDRIVHSTRYSHRLATLDRELPYRVAVVGGAQSAAEMFRALQDDLPNAHVAWVMRSLGPSALQSSKFTNEMYYPGFVDKVYGASSEGREAIRQEMHRTNYSGVEPELLDALYADRYVGRLTNQTRTSLVPMVEIVGGAVADGGDGVVLELADRTSGERTSMPLDLVFLGTGFDRRMPRLIRDLGDELGLDEIAVSRAYRLELGEPAEAACYLQGVNEGSHGVGDSLFSVMAIRAADTLRDILADRAGSQPRPPAPDSRERLLVGREPVGAGAAVAAGSGAALRTL
jgi:L-ornithine N5-oxygenase